MSWISKLYETYENAGEWIGKVNPDKSMLLPIAHSTQNAQIELVLDAEGKFKRAMEIPKGDAITVIPVTEDSAARSSGITPHPFMDKLLYVAGDYHTYVKDTKNRDFIKYFEAYQMGLNRWNTFDYANAKVHAVLTYINKKSMIGDLVSCGVLELKEGRLDPDKKISGISQAEAFIRFRVEDEMQPGEESALWKDPKMYDAWSTYYLQTFSNQDLCYVTGKEVCCSDKHPGKIRHAADKSKLISANDKAGFSYRGRFVTKEEASSVGYEVSQKAHNALKWLIERQGIRFGEMVVTAWGTQGLEQVDVVGQTEEAFWLGDLNKAAEEEDFLRAPGSGELADTRQVYARHLKHAIFGSTCKLEEEEDIVVLALEAATTGRLSITYYKEMNLSRYRKNILSWYENCVWLHWYRRWEGKELPCTGTPSLEDIALAAYGTEQSNSLAMKDVFKKQAVLRLIPCILENKPIPGDIVERAVRNASRPAAFGKYNWSKVLSVACALVMKVYHEKKEEYTMALDEERRDRSYLYGRLLAVAQEAEKRVLNKNKIDRLTNAERYMNAFQKHPFSTWGVIYKRLQPYFKSLGGSRTAYQEEIDRILDSFPEDANGKTEYEHNETLDGSYLLGYSSQLEKYRLDRKKRSEEKIRNEEKEKEV